MISDSVLNENTRLLYRIHSKLILKALFKSYFEHIILIFSSNFEHMQNNIQYNDIVPAGICLFKVNNGNPKTMFEIYSKLQIKIPKLRQWHCSGSLFHIFFKCFCCRLWTSKYFFIVDFEQVNTDWSIFVFDFEQVYLHVRFRAFTGKEVIRKIGKFKRGQP